MLQSELRSPVARPHPLTRLLHLVFPALNWESSLAFDKSFMTNISCEKIDSIFSNLFLFFFFSVELPIKFSLQPKRVASVISALRSLRQEDCCKLTASLGYIVRSCLRTTKSRSGQPEDHHFLLGAGH